MHELFARFSYKPGVRVELVHNRVRITGISPQPAEQDIPDMALGSEDSFWIWLRIFIIQLERHELEEWFRVDGVPYRTRRLDDNA